MSNIDHLAITDQLIEQADLETLKDIRSRLKAGLRVKKTARGFGDGINNNLARNSLYYHLDQVESRIKLLKNKSE